MKPISRVAPVQAGNLAISSDSQDNFAEEIEKLIIEKNQVSSDLEQQLKVNAELKRLLVASLGNDLQGQVESLVREKTMMTESMTDLSHHLEESRDYADQLHIQADMWRSKFLASQLLVDELSQWKAQMTMRVHQLVASMNNLFGERYELWVHLSDCYSLLEMVRKQLDKPTKASNRSTLNKTTVDNLVLAERNSSLAEKVLFKLTGSLEKQKSKCQQNRTFAEEQSFQLINTVLRDLTRPAARSTSLKMTSRFHTNANFENILLNCCTQCSGELMDV